MSSIGEIEARRAERKAKLAAQREEQLAVDIEALDAAELQHGDSNVVRIDVPYTPGLPTLALARTPRPVEVKRYRDSVRPKGDKAPDAAAAAEQLAAVCRIYPDAETLAKMAEARPGLNVQLGVAAVGLAMGAEAAEGKG